MIHVDARTPDQFYDERYDSYICFLMRGSGRSLATRTEVFQPRVGGEGALTGKRGFRSFQNCHRDESGPLNIYIFFLSKYQSIFWEGGVVSCLLVQLYLVPTYNHLVSLLA